MPAAKRKRTSAKKYTPKYTKKRKTSIPKMVSRQINRALNKNIETKQSIFSSTDGIEIRHNNFVTLTSQLLATSQGVQDPPHGNIANRIGDAINLRGVSLKMMVELRELYSDVTFRLMVVKASRGDIPDRTNLFVGQSGNKMLDAFNNERFTMLYQKYFKIKAPNAGTSGALLGSTFSGSGATNQNNTPTITRATKIVKVWIPGKKFVRSGVVKYDNGGQDPKFFDYHVLLYAYSNYNTLQDMWTVAYVNDFISLMYFKDA